METTVKTILALFVLCLSVVATPVFAKGCLKGAVVGGIAGHYAHHHGLIGAAVGCAIGRHQAKKQAMRRSSGVYDPTGRSY